MKKLFALTKIQALNFIRSLALKSGGKGRSKSYLILLLLPLAFLPQLILLFGGMYDQCNAIGAPAIAIGITFLLASVFILMQSFAVVLSTLVANKDIEMLLVLPVRSHMILLSKFFFVYLGSVAISLFLMAVPSARFASDYGWHYLVPAVWLALLAPAVPLAINLLVITPLARFLQNKRNRTILFFLTNVIFFVSILGLMVVSSRMYDGSGQIVQSQNALLLGYLSKSYPLTRWAVGAFLMQWLDLALFSAVSLGLLVFVVYLVGRLFHKVITDQNNANVASGQSKRNGEGITEKSFTVRGKSTWIYKRMFKIIASSNYAVLTLLMSFAMPIVLFVIYTAMGMIPEGFLESQFAQAYAPLMVVVSMTLSAVMDAMAQCALSREGKFFWENRVLPISSRSYVGYYAKFHVGLVWLQQLVMGVGLSIYLKVEWMTALIAIAAGLSLGAGFVLFSLLLDIAMPNFDWTMIQQIMKNGRNQYISAFSKVGLIGLLAFLLFNVMGAYSVMVKLAAILAIGVTLFGVMLGLLLTKGVRDFERIEP